MRFGKLFLNVSGLALVTVAAGIGYVPPAQAASSTAGVGLDAPISITSDGKAAVADNYTAYPLLNVGSVPPLVMLVMSRDEQLYIKAYTDYTDLDGDGTVDTTYQNRFDYSGYFDPNLCYTYASGQFKGSADATSHQCSGTTWSGNFLNWASMSRVDVLRFVLYGGNRYVDDANRTVLERSYIPSDLHAWAKVYTGSDVNLYTPYTTTQAAGGLSMCNVSPTPTSEPQLRVAKGAYRNWASTARQQCMWREDALAAYATPDSGQPLGYKVPADLNPYDDASSSSDGLATLTMRVEVCDPSSTATVRESFCKDYVESASTGAITHWKPWGLLQRYGQNGEMRFGLISGSYGAPRAGGVLRRNIGLFAGNDPAVTCTYSPSTGKVDEVNLQTGQFCNQTDGNEGIINALRRFRITSWDPSKDNYSDCPTYGILSRDVSGSNGHLIDPGSTSGNAYACKDSGNPLAEMYAEALRYIKGTTAAGGDVATSKFTAGGNSLLGIPSASWLDPYRSPDDGGSAYCANCSIVMITTGLDSFDSDGIPTVGLSSEAGPATTQVGQLEGLDTTVVSGSPLKYLIGRQGALDSTTYQDVCGPHAVTDLNQTFGICPDVPSLEGGYQMAGLAFKAWTTDLRPDLTGEQKVQTYAIALAETLPTFEVPVATNNTGYDLISITPDCQANNSGSAALNSKSGWRSCYLGNLVVGQQTSANLSQSDWLKLVSGNTPSSPGSCGTTGNPCHVFGLPTQSDAHGPVMGSFQVVWEDSQWGNDHDQDLIEMLSFCRGAACTYDGNKDGVADICEGTTSNSCNGGNIPKNDQQMLVRTEVLGAYAGNALQAGYTAGGAYNAGNGQQMPGATFTVLRPGSTDGSLLFGSIGGAKSWGAPSVEKLSTGPAEQVVLPNPLFYASKYGGFTDQNNDNKPDRAPSAEWDKIINDTGVDGSDGQPDNYFLVRNPAQLANRLARTFDAILKRAGSGTAAAVVANSAKGVGLVYQALYQAERKDSANRKAAWNGTLNGLWTDSYGRLRENGNGLDGNGNAVLDGYDVDPVVEFFYDPNDNQTKFHREFMPANADGSSVTVFDKTKAIITDHGLDELQTVWSAQQQLWSSTFSTGVNSDFTSTNRSYGTVSSSGRYIFTWIDANHNGVVDSGEQQPFVFSGTSTGSGFYGDKKVTGSGTTYSGNFRYLNTNDPDVAKRVVAWARGYEVPDKASDGTALWRSRTVDYNNDSTLRVLRLGDIVDSTPVVVGTPSEAFDLLYGDTSYGTFRDHYRARRQMVYVGANDGMLHAFNGGFYNARAQKLQRQPTDGTSVTNDPLGGEKWGYVPGNLLPHLRWLTDPTYKHNFYVDGSPIAQDVKIFADDTDHPDGWGTVLIVPFRFGGGPISVNTSTGSTAATQNSFSAYAVLDVTNPEKAPVLLAELTNTALSDSTATCDSNTALHAPSCVDITKVVDTYTSSIPAAAIFRDSTSGSPNKFFLFAGSGTTDNGGVGTTEGGRAVASTSLRIRVYDMAKWTSVTPTATPTKVFDFATIGGTTSDPTPGAASFAGDLIASDYNLDGRSESLYFGSVKDAGSSNFSGYLWKLSFMNAGVQDPDPDTWTPQRVLSDLNLPVTVRPTVGRNDRGAPMVFFGTGRAYTKIDLASTQQQKIVGLIDTSLLSSTDTQYKALPLSMSDLVNVTGVDVYTDNTVANGGTDASGSALDTFDKLLGSFNNATRLGWYLNLTAPTGTSTTPSERVVSSQSLLGGVLLTTTFFPGTDTCTDVGRGALYGLNYKSGTASPTLAFFGTTPGSGGGDGSAVVNRSTDLGPGLPAPPSLHIGEGTGERKLTACVQTSTGAIICKEITTLKSVLSSEISWHEPIDK